MVAVEHTSVSFFFLHGSDEKIFGNLDFGWPQFFFHFLSPLCIENVASFYGDNLSLGNGGFREQAFAMNRAVFDFCFWRTIGEALHWFVLAACKVALSRPNR